jgi:hypothetical protein
MVTHTTQFSRKSCRLNLFQCSVQIVLKHPKTQKKLPVYVIQKLPVIGAAG